MRNMGEKNKSAITVRFTARFTREDPRRPSRKGHNPKRHHPNRVILRNSIEEQVRYQYTVLYVRYVA